MTQDKQSDRGPRVPILVFAKPPRPGVAKTRLGREIGDERAARFAAVFLQDTLERLAVGGWAPVWLLGDAPDEAAFGEELPAGARAFDTTFSMGVLYHQRSPLEHLRHLRDSLRPGGQLVLETIFVPGEESFARTPGDRYARMRNVWLLPTITELTTWLGRSGFRNIEIVNQSRTTTDEQRSTEWMTFESLAQALKPDDPDRTVEGWPAPRRVIAVANAP